MISYKVTVKWAGNLNIKAELLFWLVYSQDICSTRGQKGKVNCCKWRGNCLQEWSVPVPSTPLYTSEKFAPPRQLVSPSCRAGDKGLRLWGGAYSKLGGAGSLKIRHGVSLGTISLVLGNPSYTTHTLAPWYQAKTVLSSSFPCSPYPASLING